MNERDLLSYYAEPGAFTQIGRLLKEVEAVGADAGEISGFVQGLLIHNALASFYQVTFTDERMAEIQLHGVNAIFARAKKLNQSRLTEVRPPSQRVVGVCRHFATVSVAVMRSKGIPARVRCGFANYFEPGKHVDHWVAEYWNQESGAGFSLTLKWTTSSEATSIYGSILLTFREIVSLLQAMRGRRVEMGPRRTRLA